MFVRQLRATLALLAVAATLAAGQLPASAGVPDPSVTTPRTGLPAGMLPTAGQLSTAQQAAQQAAQPAAPDTQAATPHLTYYGGPVISDAHVVSVLWGNPSVKTFLPQVDGSTGAPNMDSFFRQMGTSSYFSWLREYDAGGQKIGYSSFDVRKAITPSPGAGGTSVTDGEIQSELTAQINAGHLPHPRLDGGGDANSVYALFFPSGTTICNGTDCSGVQFCAYHSSFSGLGTHVRYMVLPYADSNIVSGCGSSLATTPFTVTESFVSHELIEAVTDPDVGLATVLGPPLAWYDQTNGEIADICVSGSTTDGTLVGSDGHSYVVQKEWTNAQNSCITAKSGAASAPGGVTARPVAGGKLTVHWSAPSSTGTSPISGYDVYESTAAGAPGDLVATVASSARSWTSPAVANGSRRWFRVAAKNGTGSGALSSQVSAIADSAAPSVAVTSPARAFQLASTITVKYAGTDAGSGVASYDVAFRKAAWNGGFSAYTTLASATTSTSRSLNGTVGTDYCFRVRARDHAGNVSAWTHDRCTALPLDDRALSAVGTWSRLSSSKDYRGTTTSTTSAGARLRVTGAHLDRVALVVTTCPTCGKVAIMLGTTLWKTVSTASSTTRHKVIVLPGSFSLRQTDVTLKAVNGGHPVIIDGLGLSAT